ncbi:hypothetical protein MUO65_04015 [bacterium]|nr:hypothetical protein [bacterium]
MAEEKPVSNSPKDTSGEKSLRIRLGRVDSVDLYEIKDSELDLLEKGSPSGLYLNFSIFLFSIAFSALAALCTTTSFKYALMQTVFVVIMVVGFIIGALLLILWYRGRKDITEVITKIRNRIPPEVSPVVSPGTGTQSPAEDQPQPAEPKG